MTVRNWVGNAQPRADVWWARPGTVPNNSSIFVMAINDKEIKVKAGDLDSGGTATAITAAGVSKLLKEALGRTSLPEWKEVTVFRAFLNSDQVTYTKAVDTGDMLVLTGPSDGKPVTITCRTETTTAPSVLVTEVTKGVAGQNEQQSIVFAVAATGGTFTLSFGGYTTGAIAYNASAATVETAFEALASVGAGNGTVTSTQAQSWFVEFTGTLAQTNVALITGSGASLTGAGSVTIATTTQGSGAFGVNELQDYTIDSTGVQRFRFRDSGGLDYYINNFAASSPFFSSLVQAQGDIQNAITNAGLGGLVSIVSVSYDSASTITTVRLEFIGGWAGMNMGTGATQLVSDYAGTWSDSAAATVIREGSTTPVNEVQTVTVYKATGGNFTLTFQGQTTAAITYSTTPATLAANIDAALEALSNIEAGEVTTAVSSATAVADIFTVTFSGQYAAVDVEQMTANAAGLTGGTVVVSTTQAAIANVNEVQTISLPNNPTAGTFTVSYAGQTTGTIAYDASAATVQTALIGLSTIGSTNCTVSGDASGPWTVTFSAWTLTITATGGTYTLQWNGLTTGALNWNDNAATIQAALNALTGGSGLLVYGTGPWSISGTSREKPMAVNTGSLTGGSATIARTLGGDLAAMTGNGYGLTITGTQTMQVHRAQTRRYTGGTWVQSTRVFTPGGTINPVNEGVAVGDFACVYRDNAVGQTAFMAKVTARDATTITLSADYFDDVAEGSNPADGTSDTTLLIVTAPTGPNYWGNTDNWSGATLPVDGDTTNAENTSVPILYELNQSLITPANIYWTASFQAAIGLPENTASGYREYRRKALRIGNAADAQTITIEIGKGEGAGQSLVNMDNGDCRVTGRVYRTSTSRQTNLPTVLWKGTHASNTWQIQRGSFGAGMFSGDTFTISTLNMDWYSSRERDAQVVLGAGGTVTTIVKTGGSLVMYCGFTTLTQEAGEIVLHVGAAGTVTVRSGTYVHNSSSNYTALSVYDAIADFSKSGQTLTGTNTTLYAGATFLDTNKRITFTNPIAIHGRVRQLDLGVDLNLQRS